MRRISDQELSASITQTGQLSGKKADNTARLARALTAARGHADIKEGLDRMEVGDLREAVHQASLGLRVPRKTLNGGQKIPRRISRQAREQFENSLRTSIALHSQSEQLPSSRPRVAQRPPALPMDYLAAVNPRQDERARSVLATKLARAVDVNIGARDWQALHGGDARTEAYNAGFWSAAVEARHTLAATPSTTARELLTMLAGKRRQLALAADASLPNYFGLPIDTSVTTFMNNGRYGQFPALKALSDRVIEWDKVVSETGSPPKELPRGITISGQPGGTRYFSLSAKGSQGQALPLSVYAREAGDGWPDGTARVTVNGGAEWRKIGEEVEGLFRDTLTAPDRGLTNAQRLHDLSLKVGRLHYLLAHNPMFRRGSAGIYDMLTATIFLRHGFVFPGWKVETPGDIQALGTLDWEAYAGQYLQLMRRLPSSLIDAGISE